MDFGEEHLGNQQKMLCFTWSSPGLRDGSPIYYLFYA